jgi:hypothetical protein
MTGLNSGNKSDVAAMNIFVWYLAKFQPQAHKYIAGVGFEQHRDCHGEPRASSGILNSSWRASSLEDRDIDFWGLVS